MTRFLNPVNIERFFLLRLTCTQEMHRTRFQRSLNYDLFYQTWVNLVSFFR